MGSLGSKPPPPPPPYVPPYTPPAEPPPPDPEATAAENRRAGLLRRNRGRFGTVQTSFRGLLGLAADGGQRKTLLGE